MAGKVVVDVGAGNGILKWMAAEAGAKRVYAIENSEIVSELIKGVRSRELGGRVKVMKIIAEDAPLPKDELM